MNRTQPKKNIDTRGASPSEHYRAALSPEQSVWVNASAGSGKTNILTKRVLSLLLSGIAPSKILCLTYTKAAAAEMAERVRTELASWVAMTDADLYKKIIEVAYDDMIDDAMIARARFLFAKCLDTPDGLRIQTLHAFCQSVLQRFPIEADILPNFKVLEESERSVLIEQSIADVLWSSNSDADIQNAAQILSDVIGDEDRLKKLIVAIIEKYYWLDRADKKHGGIDAMCAEAAELLGVDGTLTEHAIMADACDDANFNAAELRRAGHIMAEGTKREIEQAAAMLSWLAMDTDARAENFSDYCLAYLTDKGKVRDKLVYNIIKKNHPDIEAILSTEANRVLEINNRISALSLLAESRAALTLGTKVYAQYTAHKQTKGALDFDDLIAATRRLLEKPGIAPWILFKLDGGIDHVLIDEAQDTSQDQWRIIRLLTEEFFSGEGVKSSPTSVFSVGDPKQSIFSFQRADPRGFIDGEKHFKSAAFAARKKFSTLPLIYSFRTAPPILEFIDWTFTHTQSKLGVSVIHGYEEQAQSLRNEAVIRHIAMRDGSPGTVEIWPLFANQKSAKPERWHIPDQADSQAKPKAKLADAIADTIAGWLQRGVLLPEHAYTKRAIRPIEPGDIKILVRTRTDFVQILTRALKARAIPVAGIDRLILSHHIAVMDLLALGKFLSLPDDSLSLACVLKSPLCSIPPDRSEDILFQLSHNRGDKSLWQRLCEEKNANTELIPAHDYLSRLLQRCDFTPPFGIFSDVLSAMGGRRAFLSRFGAECIDPLDEFLNLSAKPMPHARNMKEFIAAVEEDETEVKRDMDTTRRNQVQIMTVHAAKGLQAPIVFLPDTTSLPAASRNKIEFLFDDKKDVLLWPSAQSHIVSYAKKIADRNYAKTLEEYRRLLYVAATRAEDRLIICGYGDAKPDCWYHDLAESAFQMAAAGKAAHQCFAHSDNAGYRIGTDFTATDRPKQIEQDAAKPNLEALPDWISNAAPNPEPTPRILRPSGGVAAEDFRVSPLSLHPARAHASQSNIRGVIIHRLLQTVPDLPKAKWQDAVHKFLQYQWPNLHCEEKDRIGAEVFRLLNDPDLADYFGPGSRAEAAISGIVQNRQIAGQIDRMVVTQTHVKVLDYKTGRPAVPDIPQSYIRQMSAYYALLTKIYPQHQVECAILWTQIPKLTPIPRQILQSQPLD